MKIHFAFLNCIAILSSVKCQSVFQSFQQKIAYVGEGKYNNYLTPNPSEHFKFLEESLKEAQISMKNSKLKQILEEHKMLLNHMLEIVLIGVGELWIDSSFSHNKGWLHYWRSRTTKQLRALNKAKKLVPPNPQKVKELEDGVDALIQEVCYLIGSIAGADAVRIIVVALMATLAICWGNVLLPETDWNPETTHFLNFGDYEQLLHMFWLEKLNRSAMYSLSTIRVNRSAGYYFLTMERYLDDEYKVLLHEALNRSVFLIRFFNETVFQVNNQVSQIVLELKEETDGWKNRLNRKNIPFLKMFDALDVVKILDRIKSALQNHEQNLGQVDPEVIDRYYEVYYKHSSSQSLYKLYQEVKRFRDRKGFVDCALAVVRHGFREYIRINEPNFAPQLPKLTYRMTTEVALFKFTLGKELFGQQLFPFAHTHFMTLPSPIGVQRFDDQSQASSVRERTADAIRAFSGQVVKAGNNSAWQRAGPTEFFKWKHEEFIDRMERTEDSVINRIYGIIIRNLKLDVLQSPQDMGVIAAQSFSFTLRARDPAANVVLEEILSETTIHANHSGYSAFIADSMKFVIMHSEWQMKQAAGNRAGQKILWESQTLQNSYFLISPFTSWDLWFKWPSSLPVNLRAFIEDNPTDIILTMEWKYLPVLFDWNSLNLQKYYDSE